MHKVIFNLTCISALMPSIASLLRTDRSAAAKAYMALFLCALAILATLFISTGMQNALAPGGSHDFQWTPSKDIVDGVNPYRDFITWQEQGKEGVPIHFLNQSPSYPASSYVLLSPFAHFDWEIAKTLWLMANLIFIGLLLLGMQKVFPVSSPTVLALLVLSFLLASPLRISLGAGQHNLVSLAAFIWAYHYAHNGNNKTLSGLLLSIAWIKYSLTFPLTLIFLRPGTFKPVAIAAAVHALLTCIAAWRIDMLPHEFFFNSVQVVLMGDGTGFLNLIALSMNMQLPLPLPFICIGLASVTVTAVLYRNQSADPMLVMAFLGLFSCAVFYHHDYDFVVLLMCAWLLAQGKLQGIIKYSTVSLLSFAWVGQWLVKELSLGSMAQLCVGGLLIIVFYYTVFLYARALYQPRAVLKPATAISF